jgi:hypothetical protein
MRIAFDLDGTLADMHAALAEEAARLFPGVDPDAVPNSTDTAVGSSDSRASAPEPRVSTRSLSASQMSELWATVCRCTNFWESLAEIEPGVIARLYAVATARRWEVIFITSRPESAGDTAQVQSHRWLARHGFATPSVYVCHGSRGRIATALALDAFIDDRPENCLDITLESQARAVLVWRGDEAKVPGNPRQLGIGTVSSIHACLDLLEQIDEGTSTGSSVVSKLKSLLGIKPKESTSSTPRRGVVMPKRH